MAGPPIRHQPLELDEVAIGDAAAEEPIPAAHAAGSASGGGARRSLAASLGVLLTGAAAMTVWAGRAGTRSDPALRRASADSSIKLENLEGDSAAQLGKDLFDFESQARRSAEPQANVPVENMHDGNLCDDDEEMFGKLCYKKCSILTHGQFPRRTSAWSCCEPDESGRCGISNEKVEFSLCGGYDVNGDRAGNGCPHPAGACLQNEEVHLGRCFKKCSLLTDSVYPTRVAAATCCKATEEWRCWNIMNLKTRKEFNVGGGTENGEQWPRFPETALTEQQ